jgi:hypothetical protein
MKETMQFGRRVAIALVVLATLACLSETRAAGKARREKSGDERSYRRTDKLDKVWLAEGFDFKGYDAILVEEAKVDSSVKPKDEKETERLRLAQGTLARNLALSIEGQQVVKLVTTRDTEVASEQKVLRMEPTVIKFSRGSSAARYGVGFGAGMPYIQVRLLVREVGSEKPLFECELDEKADWFASGYSSSRSLQSGAAIELAEDVAEYIGRVARGEKIKYKK